MWNDPHPSPADERVASGTLALAVAGAGLVALAGPGDLALAVISILPLLCSVAGVIAVGLAVWIRGPLAFPLFVGLVVLAGPYAAGLYALQHAGTAIGLLLLLLSGFPAWFAIHGDTHLHLKSPIETRH